MQSSLIPVLPQRQWKKQGVAGVLTAPLGFRKFLLVIILYLLLIFLFVAGRENIGIKLTHQTSLTNVFQT